MIFKIYLKICDEAILNFKKYISLYVKYFFTERNKIMWPGGFSHYGH